MGITVAEDTIKNFLNDYLVLRDIKKCNSYLFKDIVCYTDCLKNVAKGSVAVLELLSKRITDYLHPIQFKVLSLEMMNSIGEIYNYTLDIAKYKEARETIINRVNLTLCRQQDEYMIISITIATIKELKSSSAPSLFSIAKKDKIPEDNALYSATQGTDNTKNHADINHYLFELALKESHIRHWEYDIINNKCILTSDTNQKYAINNFPNTMIKNNLVHDSCIGVFKQLHNDVRKGMKTVDATVKMQDTQGIFKWYHITYTNIFNKHGEPFRAIGISNNVSGQIAMQKMYRKEIEYRSELEDNIVTYFCFNITKDRLEEFSCKEDHVCNYEVGVSSKEFLKHMANFIVSAKDREEFEKIFSKDNILQAFFEGKSKFHFSYRVRNESHFIIWVTTYINLMCHPFSGDIIAFVYTKDINTKKIMESVIHKITLLDYDYIICLSLMNNNYVMYTRGTLVEQLPPQICTNYEETFKRYINAYVVAEDKERIIKELSLQNIESVLNSQKDFITFYSITTGEGKIAKKKLQCTYNDKENNLVLLTTSDVSDVYFEEQRKNALLKDALLAAEQASIAKSEFLSRMSHEIRTPMNAIIGLTHLASQNVEQPKKISCSLEKIDLSARFLLSLINDILDMSRIESGKLSLKEEVIRFKQFISNINAMMNTQAQAKQVEYQCLITNSVGKTYIGDSIKLQQVLVNIISNAIKFTPKGGKVQFIIEQISKTKTHATLRFTVTDNGVGISNEFLPKLFEPFCQEYVGTTSCYGGTGLGLSICKNIVNMFGGNIEVESQKGIGTTFIVEIKIKVSSCSLQLETTDFSEVSPVSNAQNYDFSGKRILLAEDHPLNVEIARQLLLRKGFEVEVASNGAVCVEMFSFKAEEYYDAILMDVRMPVLDGLAATRKIRNLEKKKGSKQIPIIAMTANAFEEDRENSIKSGMNAHLAKPVDPKQLYSQLYKSIVLKIEDRI